MRPRRFLLLAIAFLAIVAALRYEFRFSSFDSSPRGYGARADSLSIGELHLTHCELRQKLSGATTSAYCTRFDVPENWDEPHGRHIQLNVAVVKSTAAIPKRDPIVFLDGGPGQAATEDYPSIAPALAPLRREHHILLIDQRGTGGSNALTCASNKEQANDQVAVREDHERTLTELRNCLKEVSRHADPRYYTTTDAVRDLEAIRVAMGSPVYNLVGVSYGTRVAQQYARRYAQGVRSLVLDSVVPNTLGLGADHARNLEDALQAQFRICTLTPVCKARFGDPYATLYALRETLQKSPPVVAVRNPVTFALETHTLTSDSLAGIVRMYAYSAETSALLPLTLDEAAKGNFAPLLGQEVLMTSDLTDRIVGGVQLSVICTEDIDLLQEEPRDAQTLIGNKLTVGLKAACKEWPAAQRPRDFHEPLSGALPVLILSGEYDPVTPPSYAEQILKTLSHARALVATGQGHNVIVRGCMPKLVEDFVNGLDAQSLDAKCLQVLKPLPAFINYSGAAP